MGMSFLPADHDHEYGHGDDRYATQPLAVTIVEADHPDDVRAEKRLRGLEGRVVHLYTHSVGINWWHACDLVGVVLGFTWTLRGTRVICLQTDEHACVAVPVRAVDAVEVLATNATPAVPVTSHVAGRR